MIRNMGKIAIDSYQFDRVKNFLYSDEFSTGYLVNDNDAYDDVEREIREDSKVVNICGDLFRLLAKMVDDYRTMVNQIVENYVALGNSLLDSDEAIQVTLYGANHYTENRDIESVYADIKHGDSYGNLLELYEHAGKE